MASKNDKCRKKRVAKRLTLEGMLGEKQWHSAIGFDIVDESNQKKKVAMVNTSDNRAMFEPAGYPSQIRIASKSGSVPGELLIHRSSRALWKVSDDGQRIEPAFADDIITIGEDDE
jgi:hypothetical protein